MAADPRSAPHFCSIAKRTLGSQVRRGAVVLQARQTNAALFAELHPEAVFAAPEAELAEQIMRRAFGRAGHGDLHGRAADCPEGASEKETGHAGSRGHEGPDACRFPPRAVYRSEERRVG